MTFCENENTNFFIIRLFICHLFNICLFMLYIMYCLFIFYAYLHFYTENSELIYF